MASKNDLIRIFRDTESLIHTIKPNNGGSIVFYDFIIDEYSPANSEGVFPTITVVNNDTLDAMSDLLAEGFTHPLVLNMASDICPGGGVRSGAMAQEECICRRTTLFPLLTGLKNKYKYNLYPFKSSIDRDLETNRKKREFFERLPKEGRNYDGKDTVIYTQNVILLRNRNYDILREEDRVQFDVISVAGIRRPELVNGKLNDADEDTLRMKIYQIMAVANLYGHDSVVLGALGCGAFRGPPNHIASIFRDVLREIRCTSVKKVVFAVLSVGDCRNYEIFSRVFKA
jgi:hypothetical protein